MTELCKETVTIHTEQENGYHDYCGLPLPCSEHNPSAQLKVELLSHWGGDKETAHAAWASSTDLTKLVNKTDEDIRRIAAGVVANHHDTPKERTWMEFFITLPINCERQFDKYRMTVQYQDFQVEFLQRPMGGNNITQNELSGRYRTIPARPYELPNDICNIVARAGRGSVENSKQGWLEALQAQHELYQESLDDAKKAEKEGKITNAEYKRVREVLRGLLGTAFLTDMRITMNLNAFEHIINQRLASDAQLESRIIAYLMLKEAGDKKVAPQVIEKMVQVNGWGALIDSLYNYLSDNEMLYMIGEIDHVWKK